jgi:hypothetical protein
MTMPDDQGRAAEETELERLMQRIVELHGEEALAELLVEPGERPVKAEGALGARRPEAREEELSVEEMAQRLWEADAGIPDEGLIALPRRHHG